MKLADASRRHFKLSAPRGFAALMLFLVLALFVEFLIVYSFQSLGLIDKNVLVGTFQVPATNWVFNVSISPLFNLLPVAVLVVLVSSWSYMARYVALAPSKTEIAKRTALLTKREQEKRRFKALRRLSKRMGRRLQRIGRTVEDAFLRIPGISFISRRLYLARANVRSAVAVLAVFLLLSLLLLLVVYPDLVYRLVVGLYMGNSTFHNFVLGTINWTRGVGEALPPLGGLGNAINNALIGAAPGFRKSLAQVGASITSPIVQLDMVGKYVFSQSIAAWASAFIALFYGTFVSPRRVRKR